MIENVPTQITPLNTVQDAISFVEKHRNEGVTCPCCQQNARVYHRPLNSSMAAVLKAIYLCTPEYYKEGYLHVENYLKTLNCPASIRGDFPKLRFWELIEAKSELREDNSTHNGYYRITTKGENFVEGLIEVPKQVFIYNNKCLGFSNDSITFERAVQDAKFNFNTLIKK